jgi:AAA domain
LPHIRHYERIFTPSAPLRNRKLFLGRAQEENDIQADLRRPGVHPIITGERGVGKTTLARQAISLKHGRIMVGCSRAATFSDIFKPVLAILGFDVDQTSLSKQHADAHRTVTEVPGMLSVKAEGVEKRTTTHEGLGARNLTPWVVFECLRKHEQKVIIVLDEYDLIPRGATRFHAQIADLIKTLSDNNEDCDSRLMIIGVARSAEALLGKHESIARCGDEIWVRPLRNKDVLDFLSRAESALDITFAPGIKETIVTEANGYPYYVHLIGLLSIESMLARPRHNKLVTPRDLSNAQQRAWQRSIRSVLGKHREVLRSLTREELDIVRGVVAKPHGIVSRADLELEFAGSRGWQPANVNTVIVRLIEKYQLLHWKEKEGTVRFVDPLLPLFLRGWWFPLLPVQASTQLELFQDDEQD